MKSFNPNEFKNFKDGYILAPYKIIIESTIIYDKNGVTTIYHINRFKRWMIKVEKFIYNSVKKTLT
jgi:hypothetical protein